MNLSIERGRHSTNRCGCCGDLSHTFRGFVNNDDGAYAVYFAGYTEHHKPPIATIVVSLGNWGEGSTPVDRQCAVMKVRNFEGNMQMMTVGPEGCPWDDIGALGRLLTRDEMLKGPLKEEFFHVADHALEAEDQFRAYLLGEEGMYPSASNEPADGHGHSHADAKAETPARGKAQTKAKTAKKSAAKAKAEPKPKPAGKGAKGGSKKKK